MQTKTNRDLVTRVFALSPDWFVLFTFLWLAIVIALFWFHDTQLKTALNSIQFRKYLILTNSRLKKIREIKYSRKRGAAKIKNAKFNTLLPFRAPPAVSLGKETAATQATLIEDGFNFPCIKVFFSADVL